jgi:tRNA/tmRNA/rRNA uracil-C5-methylase (TrmA/RlmC/RlmD family)
MLRPGQTISVAIERPAAGGRMIARAEGQVLLVAGAIPGEQVAARIDRVGKGVVWANTVTVEQASPDRVGAAADALCGGCAYAHMTYERQREIKALVIADAFGRIAHHPLTAPVDVRPSPVDGYRMRARLHRQGSRLGFFREGTHELCDARQTRQLLPDTCDIVDRLGEHLARLGPGEVDAVEIAENLDASQRVVHLHTSAPDWHAGDSWALPDGVSGLTVSMPYGGSRTLTGSEFVADHIGLGNGTFITVRRHVLAFFQGNRFVLRRLVSHVMDQLPEGSAIVDLYAGGGLFALAAAAARRARITAVEGDRVAAADLQANAASAGHDLVTAVHQPVESFVRTPRAPVDVVIVDPPRTGMSPPALEGVLRLAPRRVIYVSCDIATLARDTRRLLDGGCRIAALDAFDLFPVTPHVECVAVFEK